jgi:hypothetical protein
MDMPQKCYEVPQSSKFFKKVFKSIMNDSVIDTIYFISAINNVSGALLAH